MNIIYYAVQFIETSLLFSAFLFTTIMFVKTRDSLARRTLFVLLPVATLLFISYMYSINVQIAGIDTINLTWLSPLFALLVVSLIMTAIFATCNYVIRLFDISVKRQKIGLVASALLVGALLIITAILVMYLSKSDLTQAFTNALWAFYPLCSVALFIEAVVIASMYKKITDPHKKKLARYFLIAFIPQIAFSIADFLLFRHIAFQLTHLSYAAFSVLTFIDLSSSYFKHYSIELNITNENDVLKNRFALSDREMEVTVLLARGLPYKSICQQLHISENTVKSHIKRIYKKLGVSNKLQMVNLLSSIRPNFR